VDLAYFVRDYFKNRSFGKLASTKFIFADALVEVRKALKNVVSGVDDTIQEYCSKLEDLKEEFRAWLAVVTGVAVAQMETIMAETEIKVVRVLKVLEDTGAWI
jgi:peptide subunit release factor 1 (eRF1)